MAKQYKDLSSALQKFIKKQKVFFMASCSDHEVNLSPKGYDALRVLDENHLLYLDYPGSGNRTARDIEAGGTITLMFTAFEGPALIVRLFCQGELIEKSDHRFGHLFENFTGIDPAPIRRLISFTITAVETSCGEATPFMQFVAERSALKEWAVNHAEEGTLDDYIRDHAIPPTL